MKETTLQTPSSVKKEGEEVPEMPEQSLPLKLMMKTMVRQLVPLQSMEVHGGADIHLWISTTMEGTPRQSRWVPEGGCEPMGSPC